MPGTPLDDDYDLEDDFGDCTYARPAPYYEEDRPSSLTYPSESNPMSFTNVNGYTTIHHGAPSPFPGSTPTKGDAFGQQYQQIPRAADMGGNEMTCDGWVLVSSVDGVAERLTFAFSRSSRAYNWDAPRQHGHMV